ncbi:metal dependent phosphohydrolase [Colletotrichum chrysophilum]|uniref:Metal dependent phosphohydrolase n=1 Tax=Colletotrichum chrysophilum TaxID=1836956 RepID=A0AAD9B002_9PEZI|nr:metal dependent phosphohydrolase [Colletotrichum chrysophilum]
MEPTLPHEFIRDQNTGTEGPWTEARIQRSWDEHHAVMRMFPRAGFDGQGMRKILCHLCRTKAETTFDNWVGDFGLTYGTDGEGENLEEYKQGWEKARSASMLTSALESLVALDRQD